MTFRDFWGQKFATQGQYFCTRVISQRIGAVLAFTAWRLGMSPNAVTLAGLVVMLGAAACLALVSISAWFAVVSLFLFQLGFGFDCADGQLARATRSASALGAWLDVAADHVRQTAVLLALGIVLARSAELPAAPAVLSLLLVGSGMAVQLHTVTMLKAGSFRPHGLNGWREFVKRVVKEASDTPFFLIMICCLAPWPILLALYLAAIGLFYLAQAGAQAWLRIRPAQGS